MFTYMYLDILLCNAISVSLFSKSCQCDRSIPPKLPTFTGHPKWQCGRSILNAKLKNEFVFRFCYFTFENEKGIRFSFANLKTKKEKMVYIHGPCCHRWEHSTPVLMKLHWLPVKQRVHYSNLLLAFGAQQGVMDWRHLTVHH